LDIQPIAYFVFLVIALIIVLLFVEYTRKAIGPRPRRQVRYVRGYDEQWEFDLRLTYKRFRELYPHSRLTYEEYKRLQAQRAFKRAVSSTKNKRMVR